MDLSQYLNPEQIKLAMEVLLVASLALPLAERIAGYTKNKTDDKIVHFVAGLLSKIPRIR